MMWSILYRGPLSGCNYSCTYCPFAKRVDSREALADDARKLNRFVTRINGLDTNIRILFTPWGEALIRKHYQQAMIDLGNMEHISRVAIQTNLSCNLDWLEQGNRKAIAFWATFHPDQTTIESFLNQCERLRHMGFAHSVGVVGMKEHLEIIRELRMRLPPETYLWVNAYKREPDYYQAGHLETLTAIDPHFPTNNQRHASQGHACRTGWRSFTVDGNGDMRRCHFIAEPLGNLYEEGFEKQLNEKPCTNETCGCHIGYVHMNRLQLYDLYGPNIMERIPALWAV